MESNQLISELKRKTEFCSHEAKRMLKLHETRLNKKESFDKWSALQCLDHLNNYADFYIQEMERAMNGSSKPAMANFSPGFMGNIFAKSMIAHPKTTAMQSPKNMEPDTSMLTKDVINTFLAQQKEYLRLLEQCQHKNLNKIKVKITLSKWIKLKLGDALRVTIYHNERHILQALKAAKMK